MQKKSSTKTAVIAVASLVLLIAILLCVYFLFAQNGKEGAKTITVDISYDDTRKTVELQTDAESLRGALDGLILGEDSIYGFYVKTVDDRTADDAAQEWWSFTQNGEFLLTGVDNTPIEDGNHFEITLIAGWVK